VRAFERVRVARASDVPPGRALAITVHGVPVAIWRVGEEFFALEDRCPHAGYPLHAGELDGCVVRCPLHGWDFDLRTGFRPGETDGFPIPGFRVPREGDELLLDWPLRDDAD
jgi:nitrite reductase/ring-hydroxylating ferredoxin subunit